MTPAPKARVVVGFSPCRSDLVSPSHRFGGQRTRWAEGLVLGGLGLGDRLEVAVVLPDGPGPESRAAERRDAAVDGRVEASGSTSVGALIVNGGRWCAPRRRSRVLGRL